jgi:GxxExxY protein
MDKELEPDRRREFLEVPSEWNGITERIIGAAMEVHTILGPGLLERMYEEALVYELGQRGLAVEQQFPVRIRYKEIDLSQQRLDLVVERLVVVELKAVERVSDVFLAQLVSYMRSARLPLGLLINFHTLHLKDGIYRRINQDAIPGLMPTQSNSPTLRPSVPSDTSAFNPTC